MTTKYKIILGFASMMIILAVVTFLGNRSMEFAFEDVSDFRRLSHLNVRFSDAEAALSSASGSFYQFVGTYNNVAIASTPHR